MPKRSRPNNKPKNDLLSYENITDENSLINSTSPELVDWKQAKYNAMPTVNRFIGSYNPMHVPGVDYDALHRKAQSEGIKIHSVAGISRRSITWNYPYEPSVNSQGITPVTPVRNTTTASPAKSRSWTGPEYHEQWASWFYPWIEEQQNFGREDDSATCKCNFDCGGSVGTVKVAPGDCSSPCPNMSMDAYGWEQDSGWACCSCRCQKVRVDYMSWMGDNYCDDGDYSMVLEDDYPACISRSDCLILEHQCEHLDMIDCASQPVQFQCTQMGWDCYDNDGPGSACDVTYQDGSWDPSEFNDLQSSWCLAGSCKGKCETGEYTDGTNHGGGGISFWGILMGSLAGLGGSGHCFCDDLCLTHGDCCDDYIEECILEDVITLPCECYDAWEVSTAASIPGKKATASVGGNCAEWNWQGQTDDEVCGYKCTDYCEADDRKYRFTYEEIKDYGEHPSCSLRDFHVNPDVHGDNAASNSDEGNTWFEPWVQMGKESSNCGSYEGIGWFWDNAQCSCHCEEPDWESDGGTWIKWRAFADDADVDCSSSAACNYNPNATCTKEYVDSVSDIYPHATSTSEYSSADYCMYSNIYSSSLSGTSSNRWNYSWIHNLAWHPSANTAAERRSIFSYMMNSTPGSVSCYGCLHPHARNYTGDLANTGIHESMTQGKFDCSGNIKTGHTPGTMTDMGNTSCCDIDVCCPDASACNTGQVGTNPSSLFGINMFLGRESASVDDTWMDGAIGDGWKYTSGCGDVTGADAICHYNCTGCFSNPGSENYSCNNAINAWANQHCEQCGGTFPCTDDGSCTVPGGCMDPDACNYNSFAEADDGSCTYAGCWNGSAANGPGGHVGDACNYDEYAGCESTCSCDSSCTGSNGNCVEVSCEWNMGCGCDNTGTAPQQAVKDTDCDGTPGAGASYCTEQYCAGEGIPYCDTDDGCTGEDGSGCDCLVAGVNWDGGTYDTWPYCYCNQTDCSTGACCGCADAPDCTPTDGCGVCGGSGPGSYCDSDAGMIAAGTICGGGPYCATGDSQGTTVNDACYLPDECGVCDGPGSGGFDCPDLCANYDALSCSNPFHPELGMDCCGCNGEVTDDCGNCVSGNEDGSIWLGENQGHYGDGDTCSCGGDIIDECGACAGTGIPEGACDCAGQTLDCANVCGGDAYWDTHSCGECICPTEPGISAAVMGADCLIYPPGQDTYTDSCVNPLDPQDSECCGCSLSPPNLYWPDEDGDGLWCGPDDGGTYHCVDPGAGWLSVAEGGGNPEMMEEGGDCNCPTNYYDCRPECVEQGSDDEWVYDQCNVCGGENTSCHEGAETQQDNCMCATCCPWPWSPMWDGSIYQNQDMDAEFSGCTEGNCFCWACGVDFLWHENMGIPGWTADVRLSMLWYDDRSELWMYVARPAGGMAGDINADDNVDILDIVELVNMIMGFGGYYEPWQYAVADMNEDGILNIMDVIIMVNTIISRNSVYSSGPVDEGKLLQAIQNHFGQSGTSLNQYYVRGEQGSGTNSRNRTIHYISGFQFEFNAPDCIPEGVTWFTSDTFNSDYTICQGQWPCIEYDSQDTCENNGEHTCTWVQGAPFNMINSGATLETGGVQPGFGGDADKVLDGVLKIGAAYQGGIGSTVTVNAGYDYHMLTIMHPNVKLQADYDWRPGVGGNMLQEVSSEDGSDTSILGFNTFPTALEGNCMMTDPADCNPRYGTDTQLRDFLYAYEWQCGVGPTGNQDEPGGPVG